MTYREGFGIVTIGWLLFSIFGALPYVIGNIAPTFIDAFFEAMSGFTTTGSTVLVGLNVMQKSILFWRAETQWLGGMGIIVLSLAILPFLGVGGAQLFQAEVPGPTKDRLKPRIQDTAKLLWGVYFIFTFAEMFLLMFGGMGFFDAICHSFTTMATGGFSNYDESVAYFKSSYIHWVITFFMFCAGVNFTLHFQALRGKIFAYFNSEEFRCYISITLFAILVFFIFNRHSYEDWLINLRDTAFQVVSIGTSTGYATADFELWPIFVQLGLLVLMLIGGSAGSTGGGIKVVRVLMFVKHGLLQIFKIVHPKAVKSVKLDHDTVSDKVLQSIMGFFVLYFLIFIMASLIMTGLGMDIISAATSVLACLSNIGPGLGSVGPTDNFAHIPAFGKVALSLCMLLGRLEIFTVLVLLSPEFWRK